MDLAAIRGGMNGMGLAGFILAGLELVLIDLLLAGDNALVIAMAARSLPRKQRRIGTVLGAGFAVALRVSLTALAARLLNIPYLRLAGGLLILWIALKVMVDAGEPPETGPSAKRLLQAVWLIVFADLTMSLDNILAIAAASKGHVALMVFGLSLSIPLVVFAANLLSTLMDRYPALIYIGAAILGKVGGELILTDPVAARVLRLAQWQHYLIQALLAVAVAIGGKAIASGRRKREA
jgi:YjbE family integral membrane protein